MAVFYFARHGETVWNAERRLCGRTDAPLSDAGRRQARLLATRLKAISFEALYASPLQRARETASIVGTAIERVPTVDLRLVELSYGAWEGRTSAEVKLASAEAYSAWEANPAAIAPPEGESGEQLIERLKPFLADVAQRHRNGNVAVVCHRTVCRLMACHLIGIPLPEYRQRIPMDNAALNIFETHGAEWRVVALNDSSHLVTPETAPASTL
jgi:broad specificity phosphatase PhoE